MGGVPRGGIAAIIAVARDSALRQWLWVASRIVIADRVAATSSCTGPRARRLASSESRNELSAAAG